MPKEFNCKTIDGLPITIDTPSTDQLTAIVQSDADQEKKKWAKELLEYAAERCEEAKDQSPLHQAAVRMLVEWELSWVLKGSDRLVTKTVNGVVQKVIEPVGAC